ncbi:hypothetical protein chiPu_0014914 [Chiloscyllium punctatum]|uniref:Uncharacterized protein n=1 Tax=Chiloscyllium punctatum TaxID=137246 RepID=A0A401T1B3_CHIPU|nr:hypothetical protein [Chiloscyllium punctatum]
MLIVTQRLSLPQNGIARKTVPKTELPRSLHPVHRFSVGGSTNQEVSIAIVKCLIAKLMSSIRDIGSPQNMYLLQSDVSPPCVNDDDKYNQVSSEEDVDGWNALKAIRLDKPSLLVITERSKGAMRIWASGR